MQAEYIHFFKMAPKSMHKLNQKWTKHKKIVKKMPLDIKGKS